MEEPGYPGAAAVLRAVGAKICRVPVDAEGLDLERGIRRWPRPKLVYVTPAHQFPLGVTMSLRRRLALLEWARKAGVLIFEDDYDSEYRYSGRPVPALQGLDRVGRGDLRRQLQRGDVSRLAAGVSGRSAGDGGCVCRGAVGEHASSAAAGAGGAVRLHQRRTFCAPHPSHARGVCGAAERFAEGSAGTTEGGRRSRTSRRDCRPLAGCAARSSAEAVARAAAEKNVEVVPLSRYAFGRTTRERDRAGICGGRTKGVAARRGGVGGRAAEKPSLSVGRTLLSACGLRQDCQRRCQRTRRADRVSAPHRTSALRTWRTSFADRWR